MSFIACRHAVRLVITSACCYKKEFLLIIFACIMLKVFGVSGCCLVSLNGVAEFRSKGATMACFRLQLELPVGGVPYCTSNCL